MDISELSAYTASAAQAIEKVSTQTELEAWQQQFGGRKSALAQLSQSMRDLSAEERVKAGKALNQAKTKLEALFLVRQEELRQQSSRLDVSLPATSWQRGHLHPTTQAIEQIVAIFSQLGLHLVTAPEVDYDWFVFESLNMDTNHPARDDWETFFVDLPADPKLGKPVLRPHTTNFELHVLQQHQPPVRAMTVGKTYRRQSDASHTPMFHQFEGLWVDENLSIGNLIAVLEYFVHTYFGPEIKTRLRPYHFRFTEPSFELDISCTVCGGKGCKLCKEGWLELGGAGMTHPFVLRQAGLDPEKYGGLAWGWGVERCLAIKHGITDLRLLYDNTLPFLEQF